MITFTLPTRADIECVAADMRDADAAEVWASHRHTPVESLTKAVEMSDYMVAVHDDGTPVGIYGLVIRDILTGAGTPWMLTANGILKARRELLTVTPKVISEMLTICPNLVNHVHAENRLSIRWLRRLGFIIDDPEPVGVGGELFHKFHIEKVTDNV